MLLRIFGGPGKDLDSLDGAVHVGTHTEAAMVKEFKQFIAEGNAFELAVGIIIGIAFGLVVASLVDDVIMQLIGAIFGKPSFDAVTIHWGDLIGDVGTDAKHPAAKIYENNIFIGTFITRVINFILVALVLFFLVKAVNKLKRPPEATLAGPTEIELLTEIRDSLRTR
jgi:large conductance mechanosensitive channel